MESAHLTKAHEHARSAATATADNRIAKAGQEHSEAASAFRDAAQDTHNSEALRILSLLQHHHRKLAHLIQDAPRRDHQNISASQTAEDAASLSQPKAPTHRTSTSSSSSASASAAPTSRRRLPRSSIASNLAEKRGIPSGRRTTSGTAVQVAGAIANRPHPPSASVQDLLASQSRSTELSKSKQSPRLPKPTSPSSDGNFRRFYSAFGGVISAISAPLAFTSLPLSPFSPTPAPEPVQEENPAAAKPRAPSPEALRTVKSSIPDIAALLSGPALRALQQDGAPPLGPNESFYLVPTSGGQLTYASVVRDPNATASAARPPTNEGSTSLNRSAYEEFVDARETPQPPTSARRPHPRGNSVSAVTSQRSISAGRGAGLRTMEELALENETLKNLVDSQSKRIQMWETNSQNSFNALAQSFRARGPGRTSTDPSALAHALSQGSHATPALPSPSLPLSPQTPEPPDADAARRIANLEALLASETAKVNDLMANNEQLAKKNERDAQVLRRYREQWEKLKEGARKKDQERREKKVAAPRAGETGKQGGGEGHGHVGAEPDSDTA